MQSGFTRLTEPHSGSDQTRSGLKPAAVREIELFDQLVDQPQFFEQCPGSLGPVQGGEKAAAFEVGPSALEDDQEILIEEAEGKSPARAQLVGEGRQPLHEAGGEEIARLHLVVREDFVELLEARVLQSHPLAVPVACQLVAEPAAIGKDERATAEGLGEAIDQEQTLEDHLLLASRLTLAVRPLHPFFQQPFAELKGDLLVRTANVVLQARAVVIWQEAGG